MTDLVSQSDAYFASLNPLTRKIMKDIKNLKKTYGDEWGEFSPQQQEELLDKFLIDPRVAEKFSDAAGDAYDVFPNYKVECGEKIVVDFEDGCNTWRDEHSGPFCWRTRSQQDLTLDDLDDSKEDKKGRSKRSRSPEREGVTGMTFRNDKSIWDTQHLTAEQEKNETEEEIFRKFGITFSSPSDDTDACEEKEEEKATHRNQTEDSKLLPSGEGASYGAVAHNIREDSALDSKTKLPNADIAGSERSAQARNSGGKGHKKKKEKSRPSSAKKELPEAEQALIPELSLNTTEQESQQDIGQLSPVFIADPGESSTDADNLKFDFKLNLYDEESSTVTVQPTSSSILESPLDDWAIPEVSDTKESKIPEASTGFDFLDNW